MSHIHVLCFMTIPRTCLSEAPILLFRRQNLFNSITILTQFSLFFIKNELSILNLPQRQQLYFQSLFTIQQSKQQKLKSNTFNAQAWVFIYSIDFKIFSNYLSWQLIRTVQSNWLHLQFPQKPAYYSSDNARITVFRVPNKVLST